MRRAALIVAAAAGLVAALLAGLWFLGAVVAQTTNGSIALVGVWFATVGAAVLLGTRHRSDLRRPLRVTFVAATGALLAAGAYTSLHETTVNERLESGAPASQIAPAAVDDLLAPQP